MIGTATKKVAILQSNYIPWKGYFDLINAVDEFIFYDEMQYTKNDWRNRNKIKTPSGTHWLTIPVKQTKLDQKINETALAANNWNKKHLSTIKQFYSKTRYYKTFIPLIEDWYLTCNYQLLSDINFHFINAINHFLGIATKISWSQDYGLIEGKTERLVDLVLKAKGTDYLTGPSAMGYLQTQLFEDSNINISVMDYSGYRQYEQMYPPFEHGVSVIDLIFNTGDQAASYLKYNGNK
jgi:hypothetical protein